MKRIQLLSTTLFFLGWISNVHASTIMFTERTDWDSQVLGASLSAMTIDFENSISSVIGGSDWNASVWHVMAGDVVFSCHFAPLNVVDYGIPYGMGEALYPFYSQEIQIELPSSVYAFGFDLGEVGTLPNMPGPTLNNVVLSNGDVFVGPYYGISFFDGPSPTYAFFGFISDQPISIVSMWPDSDCEPIIDNFVYAQATGAAPVPEPMSLLLIGSGLGFMGIVQRRRRG